MGVIWYSVNGVDWANYLVPHRYIRIQIGNIYSMAIKHEYYYREI